MGKLLLPLCLCLFILPCRAQPQPTLHVDYDSIRVAVENHREAYDALLERFVQADTTLMLEECALLYYGFAFTGKYDVMAGDREMSEALKRGNYAAVETRAGALLESSPLLMEANFNMCVALDKRNDPDWKKFIWKFIAIGKVILASGDGTSPATAYKVLYVPDEYSVLFKIMRAHSLASQTLQLDPVPCDVMTVRMGKDGPERKVYFDITLHTNKLMEILK